MSKTELAITVSDTLVARPDTLNLVCLFTDVKKTYSEATKVLTSIVDNSRRDLELLDVDASKVTFDISTSRETRRVEEKVTDSETGKDTTEYKYVVVGFRYRAVMTITLSIHDENISKIYEYLSNTSDAQTISFNYILKDRKQYEEQLLRNIIASAKAQAAVIAEETGMVVHSIRKMSHGTNRNRGFGVSKTSMNLDSCNYNAVANENNAEDIVLYDSVDFLFVLKPSEEGRVEVVK